MLIGHDDIDKGVLVVAKQNAVAAILHLKL
jgi:hypothetical protein